MGIPPTLSSQLAGRSIAGFFKDTILGWQSSHPITYIVLDSLNGHSALPKFDQMSVEPAPIRKGQKELLAGEKFKLTKTLKDQ